MTARGAGRMHGCREKGAGRAGEAITHGTEVAAAAASSIDLWQVAALLAAGVIAVPLFKRAGLGSGLG